jgi:hypothetical protein
VSEHGSACRCLRCTALSPQRVGYAASIVQLLLGVVTIHALIQHERRRRG